MAANAFRHLLSRWTVTGGMSKAAAYLPQALRSGVRSSRRSYFEFNDPARAELARRLGHDSYMKLRAQEQSRLDRTFRRLTSGMIITSIGVFFARPIYVSLQPSTHDTTPTTTTATTTSKGV